MPARRGVLQGAPQARVPPRGHVDRAVRRRGDGAGPRDDRAAPEHHISYPTRAKRAKSSQYIGVTWARSKCRWEAQIPIGLLGQRNSTDGPKKRLRHLGAFPTELAAAQAYDAEARKLRPNGQAHGARVGTHWLRVNFPTPREEAYAARQGMLTAEGRLAVTARAAAQGFKSKFVGSI